MRIWLDPQKLNKYNLVPSMLFPRLRCKTTRFPVVNWVDATGGRPATERLDHCADASATPEEFGKILLKVQQDGSQVLCVMSPASNLGRKIIPPWRAKRQTCCRDRHQTGYRSKRPGTSRAVKEELNRLSAYFPASLRRFILTTPHRLSKFLFRKF